MNEIKTLVMMGTKPYAVVTDPAGAVLRIEYRDAIKGVTPLSLTGRVAQRVLRQRDRVLHETGKANASRTNNSGGAPVS